MSSKNASFIPKLFDSRVSFRFNHEKVITNPFINCGVSPFTGQSNIDDKEILNVRALMDTGSTACLISKATIIKLGLVSNYVVPVHHGGGVGTSRVFIINVHFPGRQVISLPVAETADHPDFDIVIGMDLMSCGDFSISNSEGRTKISFNMSSYQAGSIVKVSPDDGDKILQDLINASGRTSLPGEDPAVAK